ncbi:hypothetical protein BDV97DRAFT_362251 [Delphinella strobiligena]|nr:hypothetical protein BDV97DRAFT_362251 [Delphinella strobiligena]
MFTESSFCSQHADNKDSAEMPLSAFLALPPEVRNLIYGFALVVENGELDPLTTSSDGTHVRRSFWLCSKRPENQELSPALTAVDQQIFSETVAMLYSQPLKFSSRLALDIFLEQIGSTNRVLLQDVTIQGYHCWEDRDGASMKLLSEAKNLKRLCHEEGGPRWVWCTRGLMTENCQAFNRLVMKCGLAEGKVLTSSEKLEPDGLILIEEWRLAETSTRS